MDIQITCKSCELRGTSYTGPIGTFHLHNAAYHHTDTVKCDLCPTLFSTLQERDLHMQYDHQEFLCVQCHRNDLDNVFMPWDNFQAHYFAEHDHCKLKCDYCPNRFHLESQRKDHMRIWHWYLETPKIICTNCQESLPNKKAMLLHNRRKHTREKFLCPNCNTGFREETSKNHHLKNCKMKYD